MFQIDIETQDRKLGFDMAGVGLSLTSGTVIEILGRVKIEYVGTVTGKALGISEVLQFIVDTCTAVELNLLANWLYEKLKDRKVEKLVINRRVATEISQKGIRQILEEVIEIEKNQT
jgi:hypothetical protein